MFGNLLALLISLIGALFNLACMPLMNKYSAMRVTTWYILFGSLFLVPFTLGRWGNINWTELTPMTWVAILYNVFLCTVAAFVIWNLSMKQVGATKANFFRYFVPASATTAGVLFFNEIISVAQIFGGVVIILGLVWIATEKKKVITSVE